MTHQLSSDTSGKFESPANTCRMLKEVKELRISGIGCDVYHFITPSSAFHQQSFLSRVGRCLDVHLILESFNQEIDRDQSSIYS